MKLPFSLLFKKKEVVQYFLALLLEDETVSAVIFEESDGKISVTATAKERLPSILEKVSFEELLDAIDTVVSRGESLLPNNAKLAKTIFALKSEWTVEGKIKKEHVLSLKKICEELALEPIGFLVFAEAILHLLQKEEGAPVSAILVEVGKTHSTVSLVRAGRIVEVKQVELEESLPKTVDTALKHFQNLEILPARIILFDGQNNEHMSQSFIRYTWSRTLPFLHVPQVTILPPKFDIHAVLFGTATQMGLIVLEKALPEAHTIEEVFDENTAAHDEEIADEETHAQEYTIEEPEKEQVLEEEPATEHAVQEESAELRDTLDTDYFGFIKNRDVASSIPKKIAQKKQVHPPGEMLEEETAEIPEEVKEQETHAHHADEFPMENRLLFKSTADGLKRLVRGIDLKTMFAFMKRPEKKSPEQKTFIKAPLIIGGIILFCIALVIGYVLSLKATVTLGVTPQIIQDSQPITFAIDGTTDISNNTIASHAVSTDETGNVSADATGAKDIGTPAKGKVTIFSRLSDTTTLPKGTTVVASNGLQFTLDSATTIASFSGGPDDPSVTQSDVSVTASDIGKDYNFPSGTKFTISGQSKSDVSAKNDDPFTGGTKSSVTVVSQKDLDGLTQTLIKNLESKAKDDLQKNLSGTTVLLNGFSSEDITKKTFSNKVDDQTKSVSLDGTVTFQSQTYDKNDMDNLSKSIVKNKMPQDTSLSQNSLQADMSDIKNKDAKTITAVVSVKASLLPAYDKNALTKEIAGKSFAQVTNILKNLPQVNDAAITLNPAIPLLPKILPRLPQNITIVIATND